MVFTQFKHKTPNKTKLLSYGFEERGEELIFNTQILEGQFALTVKVNLGGEVLTELTDTATDEPYTLHLVEGAGGSFVGSVRAEFNGVLEDIAKTCFDTQIFKEEQTHLIIDYVREKYGDEPEYLWERFPENAVWRRKDNKKWYGAVLTVARNKLGLDGGQIAEVLDLRMDSQKIPQFVDGKTHFAGYHMNKTHWITVCLDGSVPIEEIYSLIDDSYVLAKKK